MLKFSARPDSPKPLNVEVLRAKANATGDMWCHNPWDQDGKMDGLAYRMAPEMSRCREQDIVYALSCMDDPFTGQFDFKSAHMEKDPLFAKAVAERACRDGKFAEFNHLFICGPKVRAAALKVLVENPLFAQVYRDLLTKRAMATNIALLDAHEIALPSPAAAFPPVARLAPSA